MKILLVGTGSRYNHVNLAVLSLCTFVNHYLTAEEKKFCSVSFKEFTIATPLLDFIQGIAEEKPDVVIFSVYIWNKTIVFQVMEQLPLVLPETVLGAGGPEVSYQAEMLFVTYPYLDFVISGEGERPLLAFARGLAGLESHFVTTSTINPIKAPTEVPETTQTCTLSYEDNGKHNISEQVLRFLSQTPPISFWTRKSYVKDNSGFSAYSYGGDGAVIEVLDQIPFVYRDEQGQLIKEVDPEHSIIYYESSRGCPYRCSYCLSSLEKKVRFLSLERVFTDLQFFLDTGCRLVKFVDRTFNLNEERYMAIWQYIIDHGTNKTVFHFEIAAQQLSPAALELLQKVPKGRIQFEIGIQSANPQTLQAVNRVADLEKLAETIQAIPSTIHLHLDLIAGLPYENLESFGKSYDYVASLKPEMLQLGFLKILSGTDMESFARTHDYAWLSVPPYQVLGTPWVSYSDLLELSDVERLNDYFFNSGCFYYTLGYLLKNDFSVFEFLYKVSKWCRKKGYFSGLGTVDKCFQWIWDYIHKEDEASCYGDLADFLRFDFFVMEKRSVYPQWYNRYYNKACHQEAVHRYTKVESSRETFAATDYDEFFVNPTDFSIHTKARGYLAVYAPRRGHQPLTLIDDFAETPKGCRWKLVRHHS